MGVLYRNSQGIETPVAGLAPAGQLVPSVSLYQSGTVSVPASENPWETLSVTFSTPMPDTDYIVVLSINGGSGVNWHNKTEFVSYENKTTTGFRIVVGKPNDQPIETGTTIKWQAFKLMTNEDRALDEEAIDQSIKNVAPNFSATASYSVGDFVTYNNVLYRCTVQHTASAWNASHFTATNVGDSIARYNDEILLPGYYDSSVLANIKATADAVSDYKLFQGNTQAGAEASWFGFKKTSTYWHCTIWDGHGVVSHLVYKNGTYTCNVIHEGVSNV